MPSNLCANFVHSRVRPFLAPFPDYLRIHHSVKLFIFTLISSRSSSLIAVATRRANQEPTDKLGIPENRCCANFERSTSISPEPILAREDFSPGLAMGMFSAGFPTGERGTCLASPSEPASLIPCGRAFQPLQEAPLLISNLSESITASSHLQARVPIPPNHSENRLPKATC
jgi:hypothetical protein